jgi:hypothetical protein
VRFCLHKVLHALSAATAMKNPEEAEKNDAARYFHFPVFYNLKTKLINDVLSDFNFRCRIGKIS